MADIDLVIKIPEEVKNRLCFGVTYQKDIQTVCKALNDSTPLKEELHREKEQAYYLGYEDGRKQAMAKSNE